jgi:hypothetical protein
VHAPVAASVRTASRVDVRVIAARHRGDTTLPSTSTGRATSAAAFATQVRPSRAPSTSGSNGGGWPALRIALSEQRAAAGWSAQGASRVQDASALLARATHAVSLSWPEFATTAPRA